MPAAQRNVVNGFLKGRLGFNTFLLSLLLIGSPRSSPAADEAELDSIPRATEGLPDSGNESPQQRGRFRSESGVYRTSVTAHWFQNSTRFWYRND